MICRIHCSPFHFFFTISHLLCWGSLLIWWDVFLSLTVWLYVDIFMQQGLHCGVVVSTVVWMQEGFWSESCLGPLWSLLVLPVHPWVLSGFLPLSKNMDVRLIGDSNLTLVRVSMQGCLSLCSPCNGLTTCSGWDRLQPPATQNFIKHVQEIDWFKATVLVGWIRRNTNEQHLKLNFSV